MIYEGTNGIQALDLLGRKVLADGGAKFGRFAALVEDFIADCGGREELMEFTGPVAELLREMSALTREVGARARSDGNEVGAASVPYLRLMGHLVYAWMWARMARVALEKGGDDAFHTAKLATARFYFAKLLPETAMLLKQARSGAAPLMAMPVEAF